MICTFDGPGAVVLQPALDSAVVGLLELVASVVAGLLLDHVSYAAVFHCGAIFGIAGSVGLLFIPGKRNPRSGQLWSSELPWLKFTDQGFEES